MKNKVEEFKCEFCDRSFVRERSITAHTCPKKLRWLNKDTALSKSAFIAFKRFYQLTGLNLTRQQSFQDFINSKFYTDFIKFALWINEQAIVNPNSYVDYVIKNNKKLNDWTSQKTYNEYLQTFIFKEHPSDALIRSIEYIEKWSNEHNQNIDDFFKNISTNRFVDMIRAGRISPWVLFMSNNQNTINILDKLDESQFKLLNNLLDPSVWNLKLRKYKSEINEYTEMLNSLGL